MCGVQPHGPPAVDVWISTPPSTCSRCLDFNLTVYLQSMFGVQPHGLGEKIRNQVATFFLLKSICFFVDLSFSS